MIPIFKANVESGRLIYHDQEKVNLYLLTIQGDAEVIIRKPKTTRSKNQNAYYWGVVLKIISDHTGHSENEIHEVLKVVFLGKRIELETKNGIVHKVVGKSTTEITTVQMEEYLSKVRTWASVELGLYIPEPNEVVC